MKSLASEEGRVLDAQHYVLPAEKLVELQDALRQGAAEIERLSQRPSLQDVMETVWRFPSRTTSKTLAEAIIALFPTVEADRG
jgi:hypothetical protein